jgi:hypothetical protein
LDAIVSEIIANKRVLKEIVETCNKNVEKRKKAKAEGKDESHISVSIVTSRFHYMAAALLITSRYIDAEEAFYKIVEQYVDRLITNND